MTVQARIRISTLHSAALALSVGILAGAAISLPGCRTSLEQACAGPLPRFVEEIHFAMDELQLNRSLASEQGSSAPPIDKAWWKDWAIARLKRTETYTDLASESPGAGAAARTELVETANALVSLHAYADLGRLERMGPALRAVNEHAERALAAACPGGRGP